MSYSDPIGDMISRIRNAQMRASNNVMIPNSKFRVKILEVLKQEGYISNYKALPIYFSFIIGIILGFVSGIVGIGGGIFLGPLLYLFRAANPKHITTAVSLFILINSVFGIIGQLTKNQNLIEVKDYFYLLLAVFIGGQIGNFLNLKLFSTKILALITSILVIFVAIRMGFNIFNL